MKGQEALFSTAKSDADPRAHWGTPDAVLRWIAERFYVNLDAACMPENAVTKRIRAMGFTVGDDYFSPRAKRKGRRDALTQDWPRELSRKWSKVLGRHLDVVNFLNPPFGRGMDKWLRRAVDNGSGLDTIVVVPVRSDTGWWHEVVMRHATDIWLIKGRLKFIDPTTGQPSKNSATFPCCIIRLTPLRQTCARVHGLELPR